ncbi:MAG: AraC family ligand binding domain-containing protein, partial [Clostridia bacterium]|nr:AraC family ligand binding domain-containing protein [Clostridia bacterium]
MFKINSYKYEKHELKNLSFPIIFHYDKLNQGHNFKVHWHENIEILFVLSGEGIVTIEESEYRVKEKDIVVINSNRIHHVSPTSDSLEYYCLIIDKGFCELNGFNISISNIYEIINNDKIFDIVFNITKEIDNKDKYYETVVSGEAQKILAYLFRDYVKNISEYNSAVSSIEMVKKAIEYIKSHYSE